MEVIEWFVNGNIAYDYVVNGKLLFMKIIVDDRESYFVHTKCERYDPNNTSRLLGGIATYSMDGVMDLYKKKYSDTLAV